MTAFDETTRRRLLDEYFAGKAVADRIGGNPFPTPEEQARQNAAFRRMSELGREYESGLPRVPLARCPFTGVLYEPAFDNLGLDGLWWDYHVPRRPFEESHENWLALTGAVRLGAQIEKAPFLCIPGPAVPYVCPRLLERDNVKAVVYSLPVGRHTAYPVVYFAAGWPAQLNLPNLWGMGIYRFVDGDGSPAWYETFDEPADRDFDLKPWIQAEKLLWITPQDPGMRLQNSLAGCPYLDLAGTREDQRIFDGDVETGEPAEEETNL